MNEIIKVNYATDRPTVSARELHEFLEVDSNYTTWFKRMTEYGFSEDEDFIPILEESTGGRPGTDHQITFDMAKEISMLQRTDKGKEVRQYFIQLEKHWNSPEQIMARALRVAQSTIDHLTQQRLIDKPKVEFFDQVASSKNSIDMLTAAKTLNVRGIGRNKLFEILRSEKILMSDNKPYQQYIDRGYFRVVEQKYEYLGETKISTKTVVYQKGLDFIRKLLKHYG